jgi:hypothetical protein
VAEAEATVADVNEELKNADDDESGSKPAARRNKPPSKFSPGGFTNKDIYKEYEEAKSRIAQPEAERAHLVAERNKRTPEVSLGCPSPKAPPGLYTDQNYTILYDKLVPLPHPRKGFDKNVGIKTIKDPRRVEQIFYDAMTGNMRAAWLICQWEMGAREAGHKAAHDLYSVTSYCNYLPCGFDPGYSAQTASGVYMRTVVAEALADEAKGVHIKNVILTNALRIGRRKYGAKHFS